ncbi:hypothetical protein VR44_30895 [Streptomyces katrae]|uniref:Uncharacterized protein n=1 Tax=Streptomyces katrae TaxID=68223 RepID=A0A0F4IVN7_9ACTN|nr:hypothetical protein VR44_30895 [Streptomyces katrae]
MVAWLLAHHKINVPAEVSTAALVLVLSGGGTHWFRIEDPWLLLADDAEGKDRLSGWSTEEDAGALHGLTGREWGPYRARGRWRCWARCGWWNGSGRGRAACT